MLASPRMAVGLLLVGAAGITRAQGQSPLLSPTTSPTAYFSQDSARVMGRDQVNLGVATEFSRDPLGIAPSPSGNAGLDNTSPSYRVVNHVGISTGLLGFLEIGARLPLMLFQDGRSSQIQPNARARTTSLGDINFAAKIRLLENTRLPGFRMALATTAALATGTASSFAGDGRPTARPRLIAGYERDRLSTSLNAGYNFRRRSELSGQYVGGEIAAGAAVSYQILPQRLWAQGEIYGAAGVQESAAGERMMIPAEAILGMRWAIARRWFLQSGVGSALTRVDVDQPRLRALVTVAYQDKR